MANRHNGSPGTILPVNLNNGGREAEGFCTPHEDTQPQIMIIPPRRVLPIIFLPGIMGSNLRMSAERQRRLGKRNNIAWRPENKTASAILGIAPPAIRQLQLDPDTTEVDVYDPVRNPTGDPNETADQRHDNAKAGIWLSAVEVGIDTPLLIDDPVTYKNRKSKDQKARERGWGEVYFDSYRELLEMCELRLNTALWFGGKRMDRWWQNIVGVEPKTWQANPQPALAPLTEDELRQAVKGCIFPVHAMGYNWLQSNRKSGIQVAKRITALLEKYRSQGFQCEKVIVVTHSMGGLVGRALIHPEMGKLQDKVLGIVHGVMPATGAGAAYKRMRCGFEDGMFNISAKVLGNKGPDVTAVLGNAQGGLELLPSKAYGANWLQVRQNGVTKRLPKEDPYEEIYKLRGKWYGLLREEWLNFANELDVGYEHTAGLLDKARAFHTDIADTYHDLSYAHYGASAKHPAWHHVVWEITGEPIANLENLRIGRDSLQGVLDLIDPAVPSNATREGTTATLLPPDEPGDQTVPLHSAEHQLLSGRFKGVFRQTGYEHQASYKDEHALHSTLYSLVRIAQAMTWSRP